MANENVTGAPDGGQPKPGEQPVAGGDPTKSTATGPTPAGGGEPKKKFEFEEDRTKWLPPHRLTEETGKRTAAEKKAQELEIALEQERKRIRALTGVETPDEGTVEAAELRKQLFKLVPGLEAFADLTVEQIKDVIASADVAKSHQQRAWEKHAGDMLTSLEEIVSDTMGELNDRQKRRLAQAYFAEAQAALAARGQNPDHDPTGSDFLTRHERGDKSLLQEFAKAFLDDWYEPARRNATTEAQSRHRPVPRGERGKPMKTTPPKLDLSKPGAFEEAMKNARSEEGRGYSGR